MAAEGHMGDALIATAAGSVREVLASGAAPEGRRLETPVVVPRWRYDAFQRWFAPAQDRDGVNVFVGRAWRAPGG